MCRKTLLVSCTWRGAQMSNAGNGTSLYGTILRSASKWIYIREFEDDTFGTDLLWRNSYISIVSYIVHFPHKLKTFLILHTNPFFIGAVHPYAMLSLINKCHDYHQLSRCSKHVWVRKKDSCARSHWTVYNTWHHHQAAPKLQLIAHSVANFVHTTIDQPYCGHTLPPFNVEERIMYELFIHSQLVYSALIAQCSMFHAMQPQLSFPTTSLVLHLDFLHPCTSLQRHASKFFV